MRAWLRARRSRFLAPVLSELTATNARLSAYEQRRVEAVAGFEARIGGIEEAVSRIERVLGEQIPQLAATFEGQLAGLRARIGGIEEAVDRIEHRLDVRFDVSDHRAEGLREHAAAVAQQTEHTLARLDRDLLLSREAVLEVAAYIARELGDLHDARVADKPG